MDNWGQILVGLIALAGVVYSSWLTFKRAKQGDKVTAAVARESNAITFSGDLMQEVRDLRTDLKVVEKEVRTLRADLDAITQLFKMAINFSEELMLWALNGCNGPMPRMSHVLRPHFDPALVEEHERQQANPKKG